MRKTVVFVANGFTRDNVRLQPWRYIYELAKYKSATHDVVVITEGDVNSCELLWDEGFRVIETRFLSVKHQMKLYELLKSLSVFELWWSTTQRSFAFYFVLSRIDCYKVAYITCPIYKWRELLRAAFAGVPYKQMKTLWSQRLIPQFVFRLFLNKKIFNRVVVQSKNNKNMLEEIGVVRDKIFFLPVGLDDDDFKPVDKTVLDVVASSIKRKEDEVIFLYLGALRPIRGFDSLINAFLDVVKRDPKARLIVLARGASDEKCNRLRLDLDLKGLQDKVLIVGGWLKREYVWSYIELSDMVVLPFVLVPSDVPIAALESLARGKPVIVSDVDGLPELAAGRGLVVDPLNKLAFAESMLKLASDMSLINNYSKAAHDFMASYPRWSNIGQYVDDLYREDADNI